MPDLTKIDHWLAWNDGRIKKFALAIYTNKTFNLLPVLADLLEEAGCEEKNILRHLRDDGNYHTRRGGGGAWETHVRGCWVLDLLLDKTVPTHIPIQF